MDKNMRYKDFDTFEEMEAEKMNHVQMNKIIEALDFLREESRKVGNADIESLVDSTFNIILISYATALRSLGKERISEKNKKLGELN